MLADRLQREISVPLIHIADATAKAIKQERLSKIGLLGTKITMERDFYRARLNGHGIEVLVPGSEERDQIEHVIRNELTRGIINPESKQRFVSIIEKLHRSGAQGIVLGCTEIPMLVTQKESELPVFNTTFLHSLAAVEFALGRV
jgi:aspartate racemase